MRFAMIVLLPQCAALVGCAATDEPQGVAGEVRTALSRTERQKLVCQPAFDVEFETCQVQRCQPLVEGCVPEQDNDCDGVRTWGGVPDMDNCVDICNPGQENADGDYVGDACDPCPNDPGNDIDGDNLCSDVDNCPHVANATQADADNDGHGDPCDELPNTPNPEATIADLTARITALENASP